MALAGLDSTKKFSFTVPVANVPSDEVDFPILLNISAASGMSAEDLTRIFTELGANSLKIAVEDGDTGNQCYVEIERWDAVALSAQLHVKKPALSSTVDPVVNFYYDSTVADNTTYVGVTTTVPAQNVWTNGYAGVYHMSQDPSGTAPQILDSTSNANHGTTYGTMTSADLVDGLVGKAISFDGVDDFVNCGASTVFDLTTTFTLEFIGNDPGVGAGEIFAIGKDDNTLGRSYNFGLDPSNIKIQVNGSNVVSNLVPVIADLSYQAVSGDSNVGYKFYLDGTADATIGTWSEPAVSTADLCIAARTYAGYESYWPGTIDEVRLSSVVRSAGWIACTNLSNRDQFGTWLFVGAASTSIVQTLEQAYSLTLNLDSFIEQLYFLTSGLHAYIEQIYSLRTAATFNQVYALTLDLLQTLATSYGIRLVTFFKQYYGDSPVVTETLRQYYGSGNVAVKTLVQAYADALVSRNDLQQDYDMLHALLAFIKQEYPIADVSVLSYLSGTYDIKNIVELRAKLASFYSIVSGDTTINQPVISIIVDSIPIDFISIRINGSKTQYCLSADIGLASLTDYQICQHLSDVTISINGSDFVFFIDKRSRAMDNTAENYSVSLLSPTAKLDSPYSKTIVDTLPNGTYAKDLILAMAAKQGITVDYQLMDWFIPGHAISINDETPLAVIRKVAAAVGGIMQTKPNGDLLVMSSYPVRVPDWADTAPTVSFDTADTVAKIQEELDVRDGFNAFVITDQGSSSKSINIESHQIDDNTKEIRGFRIPFSDGKFGLETSGGAAVSIEAFANYVETTLPEIVNDGDPEWEVIEFIDWKGSVSHPIYSIVAWEWIKDDLGAFQISESGSLTIINQAAVPSESLLRIKYKTRYWKWRIHGPVNIPIQFYVPEIGD